MMQHPTPLSVRPATGRVAALAAAMLVVLPLTGLAQTPASLDIYWIDVEGGAATLVVTPARESVLMDTGWPRADARDALRIQAAMDDAGINGIDYLLFSHFHRDHVGGLAALAEDDCEGHWIKATVAPDGRSWSMTNGRTGYSRTYQSR